MPRKAAFYTLGCKLNYSETSLIGKSFAENGFQVVNFDTPADVYVINTCSVTENAEKECRQVVRRALKTNPEAFIAVTGCYAQLRPEEIVRIPGVDVVLGSNEKFRLFSLINSFKKNDLACIHVSPTEDMKDEFHISYSSEDDSRTRAFLKIQDGCDYKCTFCTIPAARGASRSASPEKAVQHLENLIGQGYKEIILTGVNIGDYEHGDNDFYSLLKKLLSVEGDFRLRISSIEPNLLTDRILELTAGSDKICNHFHIPLQSGSPKVLRLMQRRYTADFYRDLIHRVKNKIPEAGIGVDVIVGFPGETDQDFLDTHSFLRELPISYLHVFTYSERPDTKAINMSGKVDVFARKERNRILRILSEKKRAEFYNAQIGAILDPVFEKQNDHGIMKGFSSNYTRIHTVYDETYINEIGKVKITEASATYCYAEPINKNLLSEVI